MPMEIAIPVLLVAAGLIILLMMVLGRKEIERQVAEKTLKEILGVLNESPHRDEILAGLSSYVTRMMEQLEERQLPADLKQ